MHRANDNIEFLRRWIFLLLLMALALGFPARAADAPTTAEVESVKAVMTSIILRSSQWPDNAFDSERSDFRIGIIGSNPPIKEFKAAFDGVEISKRKVTVVVLKNPEDANGLHALYFSDVGKKQMKETLAAMAGQPTITFGDHDEFILFGGTFNFWKVKNTNTVRFEFNRKSMEQSGVKVSAQVIRLALPKNRKDKK